jgi:hypothetical protein
LGEGLAQRKKLDRPETDDPCRLLKLRQMGTYGVKCKLSFLGWSIGLVVPVQKIFILPWML